MKSVWLTSLGRSGENVKKVISLMKPYGVPVQGHFWADDLPKIAWMAPREEMIRPDVAAWVILATAETLASPSVRKGLSLLAITVQAKKGLSFPIVLLAEEGGTPPASPLPTPLAGAEILSASDPGLAAKIVATIHMPRKDPAPEYRIDVYGNAHIGLWFEVGPREGRWDGALFGVSGGEILFHGTGPKEMLPAQCTLEWPVKGMKLSLGDREYTAWGVRNGFDHRTSYFAKVKECPDSVLFGPFPAEGEAADFFVVGLT
ncbi:MAG: hypothetical protein OHK0028_03410 [Deltaproteobacteria bacterium]